MKHTYNISGMHCANCIKKVTEKLLEIKKITKVVPDLETQKVYLEMSSHVMPEELNSKLSELDGNYQIGEEETDIGTKSSLKEIAPVLIALIVTAIGAIGWTLYFGDGAINTMMRIYMGIFFLIFSALKLLNLKGFVKAYQGYDIVAKRSTAYAYIYPFVELGLSAMFLFNLYINIAAGMTLLIMSLGIIGVTQALRKKTKIQCACMGTLFKLPMTKVTFIENSLMIIMSALMLSGNL